MGRVDNRQTMIEMRTAWRLKGEQGSDEQVPPLCRPLLQAGCYSVHWWGLVALGGMHFSLQE